MPTQSLAPTTTGSYDSGTGTLLLFSHSILATLSKNPKSLNRLWHKYKFSVAEKKQAKFFNSRDRGANRQGYSKRTFFTYILAQLIDLVVVGKKKLKWTEFHHTAFEDIKKVMVRETILNYLNFKEEFEIHNISDRQHGVVISQNGKALVFYSTKSSNI